MKKLYDYLAGLIFLITGFIFLIVILIINNVDSNFMKNAIKVYGTIEDIKVTSNFDDHDYNVYVSYKDLDGNKHYGLSNYYSSTMKVGDKVELYYNQNNHDEFRVKFDNTFNIIFIGASILLIVLGSVLIVIRVTKIKNDNKLLKNGLKVIGSISSVTLNTNYQINGKSPYIINVSFMYNNLLYEAKSKNIWYDVKFIVDKFNIKELPVYIEINNPQKNYLDTSELEKYLDLGK